MPNFGNFQKSIFHGKFKNLCGEGGVHDEEGHETDEKQEKCEEGFVEEKEKKEEGEDEEEEEEEEEEEGEEEEEENEEEKAKTVISWLKCQTANEVPHGAMVITHQIIPTPSVLIEKDATVIVLDALMTKELLGQLCKFGKSTDFFALGWFAKKQFIASGSSLVQNGEECGMIRTSSIRRLIRRLTNNGNCEKRTTTTHHQICLITHFEPSALSLQL